MDLRKTVSKILSESYNNQNKGTLTNEDKEKIILELDNLERDIIDLSEIDYNTTIDKNITISLDSFDIDLDLSLYIDVDTTEIDGSYDTPYEKSISLNSVYLVASNAVAICDDNIQYQIDDNRLLTHIEEKINEQIRLKIN